MAERNGERSKVDRRKIKKKKRVEGEKKSFVSTSSIDSTKGDEVQYRDEKERLYRKTSDFVGRFHLLLNFFFSRESRKKKKKDSGE